MRALVQKSHCMLHLVQSGACSPSGTRTGSTSLLQAMFLCAHLAHSIASTFSESCLQLCQLRLRHAHAESKDSRDGGGVDLNIWTHVSENTVHYATLITASSLHAGPSPPRGQRELPGHAQLSGTTLGSAKVR